MNLTCSYCQTPFTLGMAEKVAALQKMQAENLHQYDAHCPSCGRANAVSREQLEMFTPGWQEAIKETASEPAPVSSAEPSSTTNAGSACKSSGETGSKEASKAGG